MHIAARKEIIGLNEGTVATDHCEISVTYITNVNKTTALNVSPDNFRILAPCVTATSTVILLRTKKFTSLQRGTTVFDRAGEEVFRIKRQKLAREFFSQMQTSTIFVLLLCGGVVSTGLENLLRLTEFIAAIYQQFPHSCFFIIDSEAQQGENEFYMIYSIFVHSFNIKVLT